MGNFMEGDNIGEVLLAAEVKASAFLSLLRKKREGGEIEEAGPTLAEGSGNLRNVKAVEGERAAVEFVETDGRINFTSKLLESVGRAGGENGNGVASGTEGWIGDGAMKAEIRFRRGASETLEKGLFELVIGIDIDGAIFGRDGRDGVFAEIEACFGDGLRSDPMSDMRVAFLGLFGFIAGGDEAKMLRPMEGEVVEREFGSVAKMGIPAFASADEKNAVAGVVDDVAAVVEVESEGLARGGNLREEDGESVVTASAELLIGEAFVLEKRKLSAVIERDGIDLEIAGKKNVEDLIGFGERAKFDAGAGVEGVVGMDVGVDVVVNGVERRGRRSCAGESVRRPDIVEGIVVDAASLAEEKIFRMEIVDKDVERTGEGAIKAGMEKMARRGVEFLEEDAEGVRRVEAFELRLPGSGERVVGGGGDGFTLKLGEEVLDSVIGETEITGKKLLIENGSAEKAGDLLFFGRIAWKSEDMAETGKDEAGDMTFERLDESELTVGKGNDHVGLVNFDAIFCGDGIDGIWVDAKSVERGEDITRRVRGAQYGGGIQDEQQDNGTKPHVEV